MILSTTTKSITFFTEKKTVGPINMYFFLGLSFAMMMPINYYSTIPFFITR